MFRHQQNASMNNALEASPEGRGNLKGFYSYKNTFEKDSVWLDVPKHGKTARGILEEPADHRCDHCAVIFVDNSDPYADDLETSLAESSAEALAQARNNRWGSSSRASDAESQGLDTLSTVASHDRFPYSPIDPSAHSVSYPSPSRSRGSAMPPPTSPAMSVSSSNNTNINFLLNPSHSLSPSVDPLVTPDQRNTSLPSRPAASQRVEYREDNRAEKDFEIAFFLRHYAEGPGLWYVF